MEVQMHDANQRLEELMNKLRLSQHNYGILLQECGEMQQKTTQLHIKVAGNGTNAWEVSVRERSSE